MEFFILIILILLNGVFAMSEIALVTARRARLNIRAVAGSKSAQTAIRLGQDPTRFLSTVQIGITSIGLLSGIVGDSAFAVPLSHWLQSTFPLSASTSMILATLITVMGITYLSIVVGELVPKRLGQLYPEALACLVARPMEILSIVSRPFVVLLSTSTRILLQLLGAGNEKEQSVTEEEIQAMVDEGSASGTIEDKQREMVRNVFLLDDRQASSIMLPRAEIIFLDSQNSDEDNLRILRSCHHSWFPVCRGGLANVIGIIPAREAMLLALEGKLSEIESHCQPPVFIPETLTSLELLEYFQSKGMHTVFVVDEYGTLGGIVTTRDIVEILAGQIGVPAEEAWAIRREDGSWLMDGTIPILDLKNKLGISSLPDEDKKHYTILSGMIMYLLGRIPREGEHLEWADWRFEIVDMDGNRIDKVLVESIKPTDTAS